MTPFQKAQRNYDQMEHPDYYKTDIKSHKIYRSSYHANCSNCGHPVSANNECTECPKCGASFEADR